MSVSWLSWSLRLSICCRRKAFSGKSTDISAPYSASMLNYACFGIGSFVSSLSVFGPISSLSASFAGFFLASLLTSTLGGSRGNYYYFLGIILLLSLADFRSLCSKSRLWSLLYMKDLLIVLNYIRYPFFLCSFLYSACNDLFVLICVTHYQQLEQAPPRLSIFFLFAAFAQARLLPQGALSLLFF